MADVYRRLDFEEPFALIILTGLKAPRPNDYRGGLSRKGRSPGKAPLSGVVKGVGN